jgi:FMN reductase
VGGRHDNGVSAERLLAVEEPYWFGENVMPVAVVVGNPRLGSRTLALGTAVGQRVALDLATDLTVTDLASIGPALLDAEHPATAEALAQLYAADAIVFATPTYKGSYSGILKVFLDYVPGGALAGRVGLPVMTGGARDHSLAIDVHLRPVLLNLGACLPTQGLYVTEAELPDIAAVIERWWTLARAACVAVVRSRV